MNAPAWRIWLVGILMVLWGVLGVRFIQKEEWVMVFLSALLMVSNAVTLWRLTRYGK